MIKNPAQAVARALTPKAKAAEQPLDPIQAAFLGQLARRGVIDLPPSEDVEPTGPEMVRALAQMKREEPQRQAQLKAQRAAQAEADRFAQLPVAAQVAEVWRTQGRTADVPTDPTQGAGGSGRPNRAVALNGAGVLVAAIRGLGAKNVTMNANGGSARGTL
ncbi:hypothetical protein [Mycobacterium sp. C31M]